MYDGKRRRLPALSVTPLQQQAWTAAAMVTQARATAQVRTSMLSSFSPKPQVARKCVVKVEEQLNDLAHLTPRAVPFMKPFLRVGLSVDFRGFVKDSRRPVSAQTAKLK